MLTLVLKLHDFLESYMILITVGDQKATISNKVRVIEQMSCPVKHARSSLLLFSTNVKNRQPR